MMRFPIPECGEDNDGIRDDNMLMLFRSSVSSAHVSFTSSQRRLNAHVNEENSCGSIPHQRGHVRGSYNLNLD